MKPVEKPYDYSRARVLDQEKSKLSLAEVYEQEYVKQTQVKLGACVCMAPHHPQTHTHTHTHTHTQAAGEQKEDPRHSEIQELMDKLFLKLDSLSNFHFTPKPVSTEEFEALVSLLLH